MDLLHGRGYAVSSPRIVPVLGRLGRLGVRVAIDDFGIGTTSISQLRNLPVDTLKIDQLFIRDLSEPGRESPEVIVQAMIDLAHSFGLDVVAEGVEDEATAVLQTRLELEQARAQACLAGIQLDFAAGGPDTVPEN